MAAFNARRLTRGDALVAAKPDMTELMRRSPLDNSMLSPDTDLSA